MEISPLIHEIERELEEAKTDSNILRNYDERRDLGRSAGKAAKADRCHKEDEFSFLRGSDAPLVAKCVRTAYQSRRDLVEMCRKERW